MATEALAAFEATKPKEPNRFTGYAGAAKAAQALGDTVQAKVMHAVQQPLAGSALNTVMGVPAWKSLPTWYMVASNDVAIPPDAERQFAQRMGATTVEVAASHVAMVSHPNDVVMLTETAAEASLVAS